MSNRKGSLFTSGSSYRENLEEIERKPEDRVGDIRVVASMWNSKRLDKISTRNAEHLVLTVRDRSCLGLDLPKKGVVVQIVESFIWPFVARRSLRDVWFSDKELGRFIYSMRQTAIVLKKLVNEENREQSFCKFWLDTFLCQVFRDPQRPVREPWMVDTLFKGWCKRFIARAVVHRDISFLYSLNKGSKRAWPQLGKVKEWMALDKHAERLSSFHGFVSDSLQEMIQSTSLEIFKPMLGKTAATKFMPSGSACLQKSRQNGGSLELFSKYTMPLGSEEARKIGKLPVLNASINTWRNTQYSVALEKAIKSVSESNAEGVFPGLDVEVVAIPEPGKFRIITKGDGFLYTALQPTQGLMLGCWKNSQYSTMLLDDLTEAIRKIDRSVPDDWLHCSGDFEAATDLEKKDASQAALRPLYDMPLSDLAWLSLFPGRARYRYRDEQGKLVKEKVIDIGEGQLMGHPLSFPLLCVVNLACYRHAVEAWIDEDRPGRMRWMEVMWDNVLVNGDDIYFRCPESFYPFWLRSTKDAGFKISQGKNYLSPDCAMINSQVFRKVGNRMERFGYLNLKLVTGNNVKSVGDSSATAIEIAKDLDLMVERCPWASCSVPSAMNRLAHRFSMTRVVKGRKKQVSWFIPNWRIPVHLGGLGLKGQIAPEDVKVTLQQRQMAARFIANPSLALMRKKGFTLETSKFAGALARWRIVPGPYVAEESESTDVQDAWLERIAYATRAHKGSKDMPEGLVYLSLEKDSRLKPMSKEALMMYWDAQVFASKLPPCPPIGLIRIRPNVL